MNKTLEEALDEIVYESSYKRRQNARRLSKIHKLKQENCVLASKRKARTEQLKFEKKVWLKTVVECILTGREFKGVLNSTEKHVNIDQAKINSISEQIGKNSAKIQRLRTLISQNK